MLSIRQISQPCVVVWGNTIEIFRIGNGNLILIDLNLVVPAKSPKSMLALIWGQTLVVYRLALLSAATQTVLAN
jgi:hypothetical protein